MSPTVRSWAGPSWEHTAARMPHVYRMREPQRRGHPPEPPPGPVLGSQERGLAVVWAPELRQGGVVRSQESGLVVVWAPEIAMAKGRRMGRESVLGPAELD